MPNPILKMELAHGDVLIECYPDKAPNHVAQIIRQANSGLYDDTDFHRVIEGFMAQGGWTKQPLPQLQAEFNDVSHTEGICSMARTNDPNSASDQFFICFGNAQFLDRQYTVWGKVIYGMQHVHAITRGEPPQNPSKIVKMRQLSMHAVESLQPMADGSVVYKNTINGPLIMLKNDWWIKHGMENIDLINQELHQFNQLIKLARQLRPELTSVIDGGSNMGSWTMPLARANRDIEFHTFEVQKLVYYISCGNFALNGVTNVYANWAGLTDQEGLIALPVPNYDSSQNFGSFEVAPPFANSDCVLTYTGKIDLVRTVTIDSLELSPVLIKLDIEGMEYRALNGGINTIDSHLPIVWCESQKSDPVAVTGFFVNRGYVLSLAIEGHWLFIPPWLQGNPSLESILG